LEIYQILDGNHQRYHIEKENDCRPLVGTVLCLKCGRKLTGDIVRKKKRHYHKCQTCKRISLAAYSSIKMKTKGEHDMFVELLSSYRLDEKLIPPFKLHLLKTIQNMKAETFLERKELGKKIKELELELDTLDDRFAFGKFTDEINFIALLGDVRNYDGSFDAIGFVGTWFSSSEFGTDYLYRRKIYYNS
jgi:hypothetical protein